MWLKNHPLDFIFPETYINLKDDLEERRQYLMQSRFFIQFHKDSVGEANLFLREGTIKEASIWPYVKPKIDPYLKFLTPQMMSRSSEAHELGAELFLRVDHYRESLKVSRYTVFSDMFSSIGGLWTAILVPFTFIAGYLVYENFKHEMIQ